jgi:C_GCAxxG_C_C family probable redox protein
VAGSGEVCGALTGGIMAIGLVYGSGNMSHEAGEESKARNMEANDRAYELLCRFRNEFGSIFCRDIRTKLLGRPWQLRNAEYHQWASQKEIHDKCGEVTDQGARLAAEVIFTSMDNIPRFMSTP